jgi:hypothetical protein
MVSPRVIREVETIQKNGTIARAEPRINIAYSTNLPGLTLVPMDEDD